MSESSMNSFDFGTADALTRLPDFIAEGGSGLFLLTFCSETLEVFDVEAIDTFDVEAIDTFDVETFECVSHRCQHSIRAHTHLLICVLLVGGHTDLLVFVLRLAFSFPCYNDIDLHLVVRG